MNMLRRYTTGIALLLTGLAVLWCCGCSGSAAGTVGPYSYPSINDVPNLIRLPLTRQATDHTCGVASLQSILFYYGLEIREDNLAVELHTTIDGTPYWNMVSFAKSQGFEVSVATNLTLDDLRKNIDLRRPVLVAIQAWMNPPVDWSTYDEGHYVVVVGYDAANFYFMDPSTLGHYTYIPITEFLARWHDMGADGTHLDQFGIVMTKVPAVPYDPDRITRMD